MRRTFHDLPDEGCMNMSSSRPEKRIEFLERLIRVTNEGKLDWDIGRDEYWFVARLQRFNYVVSSRDRDDVAPFEFRIYRPTIDGTPSNDMVELWEWDFDGGNAINERVAELYKTVKRTTVGYEDLVDGMLQDLSDIEDS